MKDRTDQLSHTMRLRMMAGMALSLAASMTHAAIDAKDVLPQAQASAPIVSETLLHDLVRAEAAHALKQLHQRRMPGSHSTTGSSDQDKRNEVRSIYGVGNHLHTELVLSSERYLFMSGRPHPVEGPDRQWRLQRIQPPCIHLKHEDKPTVLCLGGSIQ